MGLDDWGSRAPKAFSPTEAATMTVDPNLGLIQRWTPTQAETINFLSPGKPGQMLFCFIDTSGGSSFTLTFGTNTRTSGTLATGTSTGKRFIIGFLSDGLTWSEFTRTTALT